MWAPRRQTAPQGLRTPTPSDNEQESGPSPGRQLEMPWNWGAVTQPLYTPRPVPQSGVSVQSGPLCQEGGRGGPGTFRLRILEPKQPRKANPGQRRGPKESMINNYTLSLHSTSFFPDESEVFWRHYFTRAFRFFILRQSPAHGKAEY